MFLKLKCIAICLVLILTLNLAACLFVPETTAKKKRLPVGNQEMVSGVQKSKYLGQS